MNEFKAMSMKSRESFQDVYGRLTTLVNELRKFYKQDIPDEDVRREFKAQLSNAFKNNFLQPENMPEYGNNINSLCLEIIKCDEELEQNLGEIIPVNYVDKQEQIHGVRFKCGKPVYKTARLVLSRSRTSIRGRICR